MTITGAPFADLRYAYLGAIARAWNDPGYRTRLRDAGQNGKGLAFLEKEFDFIFPWDITLVLDTDPTLRPRWNPESGLGWWGHASPDVFSVLLPRFSNERTESDKTKELKGKFLGRAFAAYFQQFPTILGQSGLKSKDWCDCTITRPLAEAPADFAVFGITMARLLAAIWKDENLVERLKQENVDRVNGGIRTVQYIESWSGEAFPWNFGLQLHFATVSLPEPEGPDDENTIQTWLDLFRKTITGEGFKNKILINIPMNPLGEDENYVPAPEDYLIQPVALAAYNGTGDAYPFSCI